MDEFLRSELGITVSNVPAGPKPSAWEGNIDVDLTRLADGRWMVLACADPDAFRLQHGDRFNWRINGRTLLEVADAIPNCSGICINSAASNHAFVLDRQ